VPLVAISHRMARLVIIGADDVKMFPKKSQFPPMMTPENGRFTKNNNQYAIIDNVISDAI
jgi:hypothetical protein